MRERGREVEIDKPLSSTWVITTLDVLFPLKPMLITDTEYARLPCKLCKNNLFSLFDTWVSKVGSFPCRCSSVGVGGWEEGGKGGETVDSARTICGGGGGVDCGGGIDCGDSGVCRGSAGGDATGGGGCIGI